MSDTIREAINGHLKNAMRAQDKKLVQVLRLITAAIKQIEVDERIIVDDDRCLVILDKMTKQRKDSINQFKAAQRYDLVEQEEFELEIISQYLPVPLSEIEIEQFITEAIDKVVAHGPNDMGKVMAYLKPRLQGRADFSKISIQVKNRLS